MTILNTITVQKVKFYLFFTIEMGAAMVYKSIKVLPTVKSNHRSNLSHKDSYIEYPINLSSIDNEHLLFINHSSFSLQISSFNIKKEKSIKFSSIIFISITFGSMSISQLELGALCYFLHSLVFDMVPKSAKIVNVSILFFSI